MSVRTARYGDTPRLVEILQQGHKESKYADRGKVDVEEAKQVLMGAMQREGSLGPGGTCCLVAETEGVVEGLLFGITERVYHIGDRLMATDVFWYVTDAARAIDSLELFNAFERWALGHPKVIEIHLGITTALNDDKRLERMAKMYEKAGYVRAGLMFEKRTDYQ